MRIKKKGDKYYVIRRGRIISRGMLSRNAVKAFIEVRKETRRRKNDSTN